MRNKLLVGAAILVILASVAYAAFAQILTISGTGTAAGSWDVAITGITRTAATGATDNSGSPHFDGTSATFDVDLAYPGATATYQIDVTNSGNIKALLQSISGVTEANAATPSYITYALSGVTAGSTNINPNGGTNTATLTVTWDPASAPTTSGETKTATVTFNYVQNP